MTLSPQWSNAVVVRSEDGTIVQTQQKRPAAGTSASSSAGPRPIIVRPRDPRLFTAAAAASAASQQNSNSGDPAGISGSSHNNSSGTPFLASLLVGRDVVETFWIPDPKRNEMGLLESMHRRTAANRTHVLLQSRPLPELQFNFSTCTGDNIDLSHEAFRLSKTSMAILQMERNLSDGAEVVMRFDADPHGTTSGSNSSNHNHNNNSGSVNQARSRPGGISGKVFKDQLRNGLRSLHEEEYYLVRYRDYSQWAVQQYSEIAKKDHFWGKKYVEQCFAVHVGKEPGELIPITEAQFLFGVELLQRYLLEQVGMNTPQNINYTSLSKDQFRSLGVILGDGMRPVGVEGEEYQRQRREEEEEAERRRAASANANIYVPPSIWDWTPGAIKKRINHQLQSHYQALGRFVVRSTVLAVGVYIVWSYVRRALPQSPTSDPRPVQRNRRSNNYYPEDTDAFTPSGLFRSVLLGPKEVFDYLLAPAK
ncbi:uncharacterized protein TM35_000101740 [Trypanosoma theileri]|uniref:Uncharacterized protein n=1 Tax=Trypanosoma theileri TaxID=67003 RepID=A0A1X0NYW7_9TRYP|nr:uncharacterized protein TM35_000101740 [Trypanosoma theileri]ORC89906.1 hypothetical protein TM35_000101740 [Trypanosoma theileri]